VVWAVWAVWPERAAWQVARAAVLAARVRVAWQVARAAAPEARARAVRDPVAQEPAAHRLAVLEQAVRPQAALPVTADLAGSVGRAAAVSAVSMPVRRAARVLRQVPPALPALRRPARAALPAPRRLRVALARLPVRVRVTLPEPARCRAPQEPPTTMAAAGAGSKKLRRVTRARFGSERSRFSPAASCAVAARRRTRKRPQ
jgi:hypothetical protein